MLLSNENVLEESSRGPVPMPVHGLLFRQVKKAEIYR